MFEVSDGSCELVVSVSCRVLETTNSHEITRTKTEHEAKSSQDQSSTSYALRPLALFANKNRFVLPFASFRVFRGQTPHASPRVSKGDTLNVEHIALAYARAF